MLDSILEYINIYLRCEYRYDHISKFIEQLEANPQNPQIPIILIEDIPLLVRGSIL